MFLFSLTKPDYQYLALKAGIKSQKELVENLQTRIQGINFKQLTKDLSPFLINANDVKRIELFPEFIRGLR
jgi:hypothetical protein